MLCISETRHSSRQRSEGLERRWSPPLTSVMSASGHVMCFSSFIASSTGTSWVAQRATEQFRWWRALRRAWTARHATHLPSPIPVQFQVKIGTWSMAPSRTEDPGMNVVYWDSQHSFVCQDALKSSLYHGYHVAALQGSGSPVAMSSACVSQPR